MILTGKCLVDTTLQARSSLEQVTSYIQYISYAIPVTAIFNDSNIKNEQIANKKGNRGVPRAIATHISSVPETVDSSTITVSRKPERVA